MPPLIDIEKFFSDPKHAEESAWFDKIVNRVVDEREAKKKAADEAGETDGDKEEENNGVNKKKKIKPKFTNIFDRMMHGGGE